MLPSERYKTLLILNTSQTGGDTTTSGERTGGDGRMDESESKRRE